MSDSKPNMAFFYERENGDLATVAAYVSSSDTLFAPNVVKWPKPTLHEVYCARVNMRIARLFDRLSDGLSRLAYWLCERRDMVDDLADEIRYGEDFWL